MQAGHTDDGGYSLGYNNRRKSTKIELFHLFLPSSQSQNIAKNTKISRIGEGIRKLPGIHRFNRSFRRWFTGIIRFIEKEFPKMNQKNQSNSDKILTVEEVAQILKVTPQTVYKLIKKGKMQEPVFTSQARGVHKLE